MNSVGNSNGVHFARAMIVTYDTTLVLLSISLAILGAYTGFSMLPASGWFAGAPFKIRAGLAALAIGGGTWSMHFLGMLALNLPVEVNYAVAPTISSFFASILLTGVGLYAGTSGHLGRYKELIGGLLISLGFLAMHYIGMEAVRVACSVTYSYFGIAVSYVLGAVFAVLALKFAGRCENRLQVALGAIALGAAISAIHYLGILNTRFAFAEGSVFLSVPVLKSGYLASIVALTTFLLCGAFLALALPNEKQEALAGPPASLGSEFRSMMESGEAAIFSPISRWMAGQSQSNAHALSRTPAERSSSVPVPPAPEEPAVADRVEPSPSEEGRITRLSLHTKTGAKFINLDSILVVSADGHYTHVGIRTADGKFESQFCERSITSIAAMLPAGDFIRVHRSYIVNVNHVTGYCRKGDSGELMLRADGAPHIPVSRARYAEVVAYVERASSAG